MSRLSLRLCVAGPAALLLCVACGGGGGGGPPPPTSLAYGVDPGLYRVGEAIAANLPAVGGGVPTLFEVSPALPSGLALDPQTGVISGTPQAEAPSAPYTVTASNGGGAFQAPVTIAVGPALPAAFLALAPGFVAETVLAGGTKVGKIARAPTPDERIFFTEVDTGNVRVVDPFQGLLTTPFATLTVLQGGHQGLLGLALAPDFLQSGHVYVLACIPASSPDPDRIQVIRFTDVNDVGTNATVVLDGLPVSSPGGINNGGEILFDLQGRLLVSLGDVESSANAQKVFDAADPTSLAGRILRYDVSTVPATPDAGNADPLDPTVCLGLRNTFGMAVHPVTGGLFGLDNGLASDDELNFLQADKNFLWGSGGGVPGNETGIKIRNWQTEIVPTSCCWHDGTGWGAEWVDDLLIGSYDDQKIRRFEMSGAARIDIDSESDFLVLTPSGDSNRIIDVCVAQDGSLLVATFTAIYRVTKQ